MAPITIRRSVRLKNKAASNLVLSQTKPEGEPASASKHCSTRRRDKMAKKRAASNITLPDDLVIDILSRLPPKPFFRFKCVSKTWLALSSVAFQLNKHFGPTAYGLCHNTFCEENGYGVDFVNLSAEAVEFDTKFSVLLNGKYFRVVDCCNGLLLVECWNLRLWHASMYVYNPATQNIVAMWSLPRPKYVPGYYEVFSLAFDPQFQSQFHVVCFTGRSQGGEDLNFLQTFSFKTGKWKSEKKLGPDVKIIKWLKSTFVDGRLHHLTTRKEILSVDPNSSSYQVIQPPNSEPIGCCQIGQSQGLLNFLTLDGNHVLFIWTLENFDRQEWVFKYRLSLGMIYGANMPGSHFISENFHRILVMHPGKPVLFVASHDRKLSSFDLNTGEQEELCNLPLTSLFNFWVYMPHYS